MTEQQPWGRGVGPAPLQEGRVIPEHELPPVLSRVYHGKPDDIRLMRQVDAEALQRRGYYPVSESYVPGNWSGSQWVVAVLLIILVVGLLAIVYMIAAKPPGDLTVIYERRLTNASPADAETSDSSRRADSKVCPQCAEEVRSAAKICRYCRYEFPG